jgi:hypothetical protein
MTAKIIPMHPGEAAFILRPSPANFSRGPQYLPEAPMAIDVPEDFGPNVNSAPRDEILFDYSTRRIVLMLIGVNAILALLIIGAAYMGVTV